MDLSKQQAIDIIKREPVGGARYYSISNDRFYTKVMGSWYIFIDEWLIIERPSSHLTPIHELLAIAEGEG